MRGRVGLTVLLAGLAGAVSCLALFWPHFLVAQGVPAAATGPVAATGPFVNARAIVVIRHADIEVGQKGALGNQTPLTARGEERAKELVGAMKDAGITRIVTSGILRTEQTAAPIAAALKITPEVAGGKAEAGARAALGGAEGEVEMLLEFFAMTAKPTDTILLVHQHYLIPTLLRSFGVEEAAFVDATEFDRVYLILPDAQKRTYQVMRFRYGGDWKLPAAGR